MMIHTRCPNLLLRVLLLGVGCCFLVACETDQLVSPDAGRAAPAVASAKPGGGGGGNPPPNVTKAISFAVLEDYDKGQDLNDIALDFQLMNELGVDTWRGSFGWDDYEPTRGNYDFAWLQDFATTAAQHGIQLRPYIGYTAPWAGNGGSSDGIYWNDPPASLQDWYNFVYNLASAMSTHPNVVSYEIYNEENDAFWWDGTRAQYNDVLRSAAEAIRAADLDAEIILGGYVFPEFEWIDATCNTYGNAGNFDVAPFHAYPETWSRNNVVVENYLDTQYHNYYVPTVNNACGGQPIWINETGFATYNGKTELDQANWWARAFATFLADPEVEHLGIYEIKDLPEGSEVIGDAANYHLGITHTDRTKKLAFHTLDVLTDLFNTGTITTADGELSVSVASGRTRKLYHHLFKRPDGRQVLLVYDKAGSPTLNLTLATAGSSVTEYALDGTPSTYGNFNGTTLSGVQLTAGTVRIFEVLP